MPTVTGIMQEQDLNPTKRGPLHDFIWDTCMSERNSERGIAGTAYTEQNKIVEVFLTEEAIQKMLEKPV